jgi:UV-endonuclease UvdE
MVTAALLAGRWQPCLKHSLYDAHSKLKTHVYAAQGLDFVSGLALANCQDLLPILQWNAAHGIKLMR